MVKLKSLTMHYRITLLIILLSTSLFAQNRASTSYFGTAALDFRTFPPQPVTNSAMNTTESAASICNEQGDILFYSNGGDSPTYPGVFGGIWNANNQLMENGNLTDLGGCISSHYGATIIPIDTSVTKTGNNTLYYLITNDCIESNFSGNQINSGIRYYVIDMSFNNGLGKVIERDVSILPFSSNGKIGTGFEPIAAISNAITNDYWLFGYHNDSLFSMSIGYNNIGNYRSYFKSEGKITISPKGNYLVSGEKLYELNNSTGDLNLTFDLFSDNCAFSSNGMVLYVLENGELFQYDLSSSNIQNSKIQLSTLGIKHELILAPDYKIYFFKDNFSSLNGSIQCPNSIGFTCGLTNEQLYLGGKNSGSNFTNIAANLLFNNGLNCIAEVNDIDLNSFSIAPNPSSDKIFISGENNIKHVEIYSISGQILKSQDVYNNSVSLDIFDFDKGVYFVRIIDLKENPYTVKIQKR